MARQRALQAEFIPKRIQDQQDVETALSFGLSSTLVWVGDHFQVRQLDFSDLSGAIDPSQFPPGTITSLDSIDADALYFFDNTLFAPRLISAADARTFLGITGGSGVVDGQQLFDGSHVLSLDAGARKLYASDGTTEMVGWSNPAYVSFGPGGVWATLIPGGFSVDSLYNNTGDGNANLDLLNRKLYNPNGTTVAVDYGTNGQLTLLGNALSLIDSPTGGTGGTPYADFEVINNAGQIDISYDAGDLTPASTWLKIQTNYILQLIGGTGGITIDPSSGKPLKILNLPTSDPAVTNQLWNNAGLLSLGNFSASSARSALGLTIGTNVQSWDADLDALAALSGTNNIYYRSAANTWSSVTIGSNLTFSGGTLSATGGGSGTVTNTGGNLTANSVVLGAGTADTKVVAGIISDGTSKLTLGVAGTSVGAIAFKNATSGTITLQPVTGALGTVTLSLPAEAGTLATQLWTTLTGVPAIVSGTGFWHSTSGSLEGAAIAQTGTGSVVLADSPSHTTLVTLTRTALGATPNDGFIIQNTTAAANNAQQVSPQIRFNGRGWDSTNTVSKAVDARIYLKPVQGAGNPTAQLIFETAINSGAFGNPMTFDSSGNLTIAGLTASALVATDSNKTLTNVTIGTGLSYSGGTLSATGGGSTDNLGLTPTAVKTSAYTAAAGDFVPVDTTSGNVTITFPTAPADKSVLAIKHVIQGGSNVVNLALGGSDVFNKSGGPTTGSIALVNQAILVQYKATGAIWYVVSDDLSLSALDGRYQPLNSNLTTIAGLTATTDNFIVSSASAWASRTPSQVRTTLGLVIGTNVQAWDTDLDTWALTTPPSSYAVGDLLYASAANTLSKLADVATGNALISGGVTTAPSWGKITTSHTTGIAASGANTDITSLSTHSVTGLLTLAACTTSIASVNIPAGTVPTTINDGDIFADANCLYACTDAANPGVVPIRHIIRANTTVTQANDTNPHAIFTTPANGRLTLETGTYLVRGLLTWTAMSATSGNVKVDILGAGTATTGSWLWLTFGVDAAAATAGASIGGINTTSASGAAVVSVATSTQCQITIEGTFQVTAAGTLIPTQTLATAAAAVLSVGSFLYFERVGSTSMTSVGQWD